MKDKILLVEDNINLANRLTQILEDENYLVKQASTSEIGEKIYYKFNPNLLILDIKLNNSSKNGLELFTQLKNDSDFNSEVIILSGEASREEVAQSIKLGAYTFIEKSGEFDKEKFLLDVHNSLKLFKTNNVVRNLEKDIVKFKDSNLLPLIGECEVLKILKNQINRFSIINTDILIYGKTGTGKEIVANNIHYLSKQALKPYIKINCGAIPENIIESELFGYEKGSFTGADNQKIGLIEAGNNGTVFLDEVENLSLTLQAKLLRVLENREILRVGSTKTIKLNLRFIFGTNIKPQEQVEQSKMREDFYYRLDSAPLLELPELIKRGDDIVILFEYFINKSQEEFKLHLSKKYSLEELSKVLKSVSWSGNIRELRNFATKLILNNLKNTLTIQDIIKALDKKINLTNNDSELSKLLSISNFKAAVANFEDIYLNYQLMLENNHREKTADKIGMDRTTLYRKLNKGRS